MPGSISNFLDKVLGRIDRLDADGLQTLVHRLATERRFLETLFNTIQDGVLVLDSEGRIVYFNRAATQLLGLPSDQAEGQPATRYIPAEVLESASRAPSEGADSVTRHEFEIQYPEKRLLHLNSAPLKGEAVGSRGLALILHDATESQRETAEAIEQERSQALTLLAASVAHEIGNPLNALDIHLQLMERELDKARTDNALSAKKPQSRSRRSSQRAGAGESLGKIGEYLEVAKGEINRLHYIITQFLEAIRPSRPKREPDSLNQVIEETLILLGPELKNRGLLIRKALLSDLPKAPFDRAQIKQVLVNLIKNSMQAMTKGGTLTLKTGRRDDGIWFSISDTGSGIPQEQITRVFEPYYTTKKKGSGLGLMIVHRIIQDHAGRIVVEPKTGKGTVFRIWLPLVDRQPPLLSEGVTGADSRSSPSKYEA